VDRTYQPLLLHALRAYFAQASVLVKKGDLIGVPIDTDDLRRSGEIDVDDVESFSTNQGDRHGYVGVYFPEAHDSYICFPVTLPLPTVST
jgi:hypothetical protein